MDPALCKIFCDEYIRHLNQIRMTHNASLKGYRQEYSRLERERMKLIQSIKDGVPGSVLKDDAIRIEKRKAELEDLLERTEEAPPLFHPNMSLRYHQEVQRLIAALNTEGHKAEAAELIRSLIDKIVLTHDKAADALVVDLHGDLAGILTMASNKALEEVVTHIENTLGMMPKELCNADKTLITHDKQDMLVAGAEFEPATFRL